MSDERLLVDISTQSDDALPPCLPPFDGAIDRWTNRFTPWTLLNLQQINAPIPTRTAGYRDAKSAFLDGLIQESIAVEAAGPKQGRPKDGGAPPQGGQAQGPRAPPPAGRPSGAGAAERGQAAGERGDGAVGRAWPQGQGQVRCCCEATKGGQAAGGGGGGGRPQLVK